MPARRCILVIEDDPAIRRSLVDLLRIEGFGVLEATDACDGTDLALTSDCDLVLLDLLLPGGDGLSILRRIRQRRAALPVIILTARGSEGDRVSGLAHGADDYVVKPFSPREVIARIRAVLRRNPDHSTNPGGFHAPALKLRVDLARREVRFDDGSRVELSEKEADLLHYLSGQHERASSREEILRAVWGLTMQGSDTRTVDMLVARLREKLRDDAQHPVVLLTVRGTGYMLAQVENVHGGAGC